MFNIVSEEVKMSRYFSMRQRSFFGQPKLVLDLF